MSRRRELFNRRSFLRAVGTGFATLPCLRLLENSFAQAQGAELPLKFICIYHPHGLAAEYWALGQRGAGAAVTTDSETSFDISYKDCSLQPFDDAATYGKSFKDKLMVIEGLDLLSNANGHDTAGNILTGSRISGKPSNSSLDQFMAVERELGNDTRLASIALGVGNDSLEVGNTLSYGVGGSALPKIIDPVQAFQQLFKGFAAPDDAAGKAAAARANQLGTSMVDFLRADVNRLRTRLGADEKLKLDQHLTSLDELEKGFSDSGMMAGGATCTVSPQPDATKFPKLKQYNGGEPYFDAVTNAHIDVLAQAMACDITRFATLFMNDLSYAGNPLNLPADNHGSVAHTYNASTIGNDGHVQAGSNSTWLPLAQFNKYSYGKVVRLMQKLDQLGALDSTLIYVSSDMGNPALHSTRNAPTLLAGGANGKFKMGRHVKLAPDCPPDNEWCDDSVKQQKTNNHLLVSIAQAFGLSDVNSFGTQPDSKLSTGGLSEID
jgi:hypothetical protein